MSWSTGLILLFLVYILIGLGGLIIDAISCKIDTDSRFIPNKRLTQVNPPAFHGSRDKAWYHKLRLSQPHHKDTSKHDNDR